MSSSFVAGVDVGGTNIEVGAVDADNKVHGRAKTRTPTEGPDAVLDTIAELVESLDETVEAIGVGIPGVVHDGEVLTVPNLSNWHDHVDIDGELGDRLGLPVALGNDVNVGLLGEWRAGVARGVDNVLGVWMGTGIGGALILQGSLFGGGRGAAGEIGHIVVRENGALCGCGRRGCVEAYAGRRSMETTARAMANAGRETKLFHYQESYEAPAVTSKVWKKALKKKDALAMEIFNTGIDALGVGVASAINVLDVSMVVVGGGLAEKLGQDLADRIEDACRPWILQSNDERRFVVSKLQDDAGVVGAATLGRALLT